VGEIEKTLEELKGVLAAREKELGKKEDFTAVGLTSRRNLCLHERVSKEKKGKAVDAKCRNMTASWVREAAQQGNGENAEQCEYYEEFVNSGRETLLPPGVYTLDDLRNSCKERTWCPYFIARHMVTESKK